jgi:DNA-binding transcriptional ArsR family regulator
MARHLQRGRTINVEFVASEALDLLNAMYFTRLVEEAEGIDEWPARVRREMEPALLAELDLLSTFPCGQPGVMGTLSEILFAHREAWPDIGALLRFVGEMPAGVGEPPLEPGVQGLVLHAIRSECSCGDGSSELEVDLSAPPKERVAQAVESTGGNVEEALALYGRPEELRRRMLALIERVYEEHYRQDLPRRLPCLERSVAAHKKEPVDDVSELARRLMRRGEYDEPCLAQDLSRYTELIFAPSVDMGPYASCADMPPIHGLFYPCEPEFMGEPPQDAERTRRLAQIYKALGDEQRLRILHMLHEREMYVQEIVERTGLHQSAVSRHLTFMHAVGLVVARREGNLKFFSLNPQIGEELRETLKLFGVLVPG